VFNISNQLDINGTDGLYYFNYGYENLMFYYTDDPYITDFSKLTRHCEGAICAVSIPKKSSKYIYVFNPTFTYETFTITYIGGMRVMSIAAIGVFFTIYTLLIL